MGSFVFVLYWFWLFFFFFFQAEDGIRDKLVTGVQTCALPISRLAIRAPRPSAWRTWSHPDHRAEHVCPARSASVAGVSRATRPGVSGRGDLPEGTWATPSSGDRGCRDPHLRATTDHARFRQLPPRVFLLLVADVADLRPNPAPRTDRRDSGLQPAGYVLRARLVAPRL